MSAKGIGFECEVVQELILRGAVWAQRSAASHSPFDVHAVFGTGQCCHIACRYAKRFTCKQAEHYSMTLESLAWACSTQVWHRTKEKEFCEH